MTNYNCMTLKLRGRHNSLAESSDSCQGCEGEDHICHAGRKEQTAGEQWEGVQSWGRCVR